MQAYQERVVQEVRELREKLDKLNQFVQSTPFSGLPTDEQQRLLKQRDLMDQYAAVLDERISNFS